MDKEEKAQFILNLAKELVLSGKFPVPKKEITFGNISLIPRFEVSKEPVEVRQKKFIEGLSELVHSLVDLYDAIVDPPSEDK